MDDSAPSPIRAVQTTIDVIRTLQERRELGVTEIADALNVSKSTVHRHLKTLQENRLVVEVDGRYALGLRLLEYGARARERYGFYHLAKSVVDNLVDETNECAAVAVAEDAHVSYLYRSWSPQEVKIDLRLGRPYKEFHCSAPGKALLAQMDPGRVNDIISQHGLPRRTEQTKTNRAELLSELEGIRERDIAFDDEERHDGIRGVAKPIRNRERDRTIGTITIYGPAIRINGDVFREQFPTLLNRAASMVEVDLLHQDNIFY